MFGLLTLIFSFFVFTLNPSSNFEAARNSERTSEMSQIMSSINMYMIQEEGVSDSLTYSGGMPLPVCAGEKPDFTDGIPFPSIDIAPKLLENGYMVEHPTDPLGGDNPYYNICYDSLGGQLTLYAPNLEGERVTLTR